MIQDTRVIAAFSRSTGSVMVPAMASTRMTTGVAAAMTSMLRMAATESLAHFRSLRLMSSAKHVRATRLLSPTGIAFKATSTTEALTRHTA